MKKKLIAAGAASLAVAAMPVVGVFATPVSLPMTNGNSAPVVDTITLNVLKTCQMEVDSNKAHTTGEAPDQTTTYGDTYDLGTYTVAHVFDGPTASGNDYTANDNGVSGTAMTLTCNGEGPTTGADAGIGWSLSATATNLSRDLNGDTTPDGASDPYNIPFGAYAVTDANSVWSAQLNISKTAASGMPEGYNTNDGTNGNYVITSGWTTFAGTKSAASDTVIMKGIAGKSIDGLIVTPAYKAYGAAKQPAGVYTGTITYTFHDLTPSA